MDLLKKPKVDRAVKPLILWKRALFYSLKSGTPADDARDHPYRPSPSTHSAIFSNPLVPTFFLLMLVLLILSSLPVRHWLDTAGNLPNLAQIFSISREKQPNLLPRASENVSVWTKKQFGFYYCHGGALYGSQPGELMMQAEALTSGYRPAGGQYCTHNEPNEAIADSLSFRLRNSLDSIANRLPSTDQLFALVHKKPSRVPKAAESASVWTKKQFGFYYCRDDVLYGSKPGELMTQAEALSSGYQPSAGHYCIADNPNETSADGLSLRVGGTAAATDLKPGTAQ